jgi:hypothetical protein
MWRRYAVAGWLGIALLAAYGVDRIEITDGTARTSGHGPALTPATESMHSPGPPGDAALLRVTAAQARRTVLAEPGASDPSSPICRTGALTYLDNPSSGSTSANSTLTRSGVAAWMCVWVNAIGGPSATREHENILAFIDATTGAVLLTIAATT